MKKENIVFSALITEIRISKIILKMLKTSKVQRFSQIFPPNKNQLGHSSLGHSVHPTKGLGISEDDALRERRNQVESGNRGCG